MLLYKKHLHKSSVRRDADCFESHSEDLVDRRVIVAGSQRISALFGRLDFFSFTDIRYYIAFILVIISLYSLLAFLWN